MTARERLRQRVAAWRRRSAPEPEAVPPVHAEGVPAVVAAPFEDEEEPDAPAVAALVAAIEHPERPSLTHATVRVCLIVIASVLSVYVVYLVRHVILLVFISIFLAVALGPPVDRLSRWFPRGVAIITMYLVLLLAVLGVGLLVVPPVVNGVDDLAQNLPQYVQDLRDNKSFRDVDRKYHITDKLKQQADQLPQRLGDAASTLQDVTVGVASAATELISILTITFFLLLDGGRLLDLFAKIRGPTHEERIRKIGQDIYRSTSGYVAGNALISLCAGLTTFVTLELLGVPFAAPLAVFMALFDLIPLVGATIAGIVIAAVTVFNDFPTATIVWLVVLVAYQQFENSVIQPVIYRRTVDVSPLITIIAVLTGATLMGVLGALLSIPVAAALQIVLRDMAEQRSARERDLGAAMDPGRRA